MFSLGKLLALPIRIVNAPLVAVEKILCITDSPNSFLSKPLEILAASVEEAAGKD